MKTLSIIGLGKLGCPLIASFASKGFFGIGVDIDPKKVQTLKDGIAPLFEPGLQELIDENRERITATTDIESAVLKSDATFIVVLTPSDSTGRFSLDYVLQAGEKIGQALQKKKGYHLVVLTSTVMPGDTEGKLRPVLEKNSGKKCGKDFGLCYGPEFIALGTVIRDFLNPDFILIGESDPRAGEFLSDLYQRTCNNRPPVARMSCINAELTKLAVNTFVTTKITFANSLARLCEKLPGADVDVVTSALGMDTRIGKKYLKGAIGFGGPCFPRDNLALTALANSIGAPAILSESTDSFNRDQIPWLRQLVGQHLPKDGTVGILGLAYKPQSDVVDESQGFLLAQLLVKNGIRVSVYDPLAMKNAKRFLGESVIYAKTMVECASESDVTLLMTPWDQFRDLSVDSFGSKKKHILIDCWRFLVHLSNDPLLTYVPLGRG